MKKMLVIILAFGLTISMANFKSSASAAEYSVPGDFPTIQAAIDAASAGDTISVAAGTYGADITTGKCAYITKDNLNLIGESANTTIIDGTIGGVGSSSSYWPKGIHIEANNVTIKNFTVKGFTGDMVSTGGYGVLFRDYAHDTSLEGYIFYDGCMVQDVIVQDCYSSIYALCFTHLTVSGCSVIDSLSDGMFIARGSDYATVNNNVVTNSGDHGIWVGYSWTAVTPSNHATITCNTVDGAREGGISFVASDDATIAGNNITNVAGAGWSVGALSLKDGPSNVEVHNNTIHNNDGSRGGYGGTGHGIGIDQGISATPPSNINLYSNNIYGNAGYGCYNYSTSLVMAENNWWGDASGPSGQGPGSGDAVSINVDFEPWLSEPVSDGMCAMLVGIDIKPQSCPNPLNIKSKGVLPVAILGTPDFDVNTIDVNSITLNGVTPIRSAYEDVTAPSELEPCGCESLGPDSFEDLVLKFDKQAIIATLGTVQDGDIRELALTGNLLDGTVIEGKDCVVIKGKK